MNKGKSYIVDSILTDGQVSLVVFGDMLLLSTGNSIVMLSDAQTFFMGKQSSIDGREVAGDIIGTLEPSILGHESSDGLEESAFSSNESLESDSTGEVACPISIITISVWEEVVSLGSTLR